MMFGTISDLFDVTFYRPESRSDSVSIAELAQFFEIKNLISTPLAAFTALCKEYWYEVDSDQSKYDRRSCMVNFLDGSTLIIKYKLVLF